MCDDTTTTTQKTDLPQWLNDAAKGSVDYASNQANKGFTSYDKPMVAGFSGQQQASFGLGNDVAAGAAPAIGNTGNWLNNYGNTGPGSVTPSTIASKMSPYMSQYVMQALAPQLQQQNQDFAAQDKSFDSAATGAGAFGDSSWNLGRGNLTNAQNIGRTGLVADAYNRAFNTAIGAGAQDVSNDINAQTTNANLGETALGRQLGASNAAFAQGTGATNLTNSLGGQQTAADQAKLNAQYNEFLRQMYQDPQFKAQMLNQSVGAGKAGADVTTTTTAPDNTLSKLAGAGIGAAGSFAGSEAGAGALLALSDPEAKENIEQVGEMYDGTPVHRFNYKGSPQTQIGLMSPEVRQDAVDSSGPFDMVDYDTATQDAAAIGREVGAEQGGPKRKSNLDAAHKKLNLSPQEIDLYQRHLDNLHGTGGVDNPDGTRSSLLNVGRTGANGRFYNVPSVYDGKILSPKEAVDRAEAEGIDRFPSYGSQEEADARYQAMHDFMDRDTEAFQREKPGLAGGSVADQLGAAPARRDGRIKKTVRSAEPPSEEQEQRAAGMEDTLAKGLTGGDTVNTSVDSQGNPAPYPSSVADFAAENPGATHPGVEVGADYGLATVAPAAARPLLKPIMQAATKRPLTAGNVAGAGVAAASGSNAGVETDRPAESFEVDQPEPDPKLVEQRSALQAKLDAIDAKLEADLGTGKTEYQKRASGKYPSTRARELDAAAFDRAQDALRADNDRQKKPLREDLTSLDTKISDLQTKTKGERQAAKKAEADVAKAKLDGERPLTEKYPSLMALPYIGAIYSGTVTYANRARAMERYNDWVGKMEGQIGKVDSQITSSAAASDKFSRLTKAGQKKAGGPPNTEALNRERDVLDEYVQGAPAAENLTKSSMGDKAGNTLSGSLIATELAAVPYLIDLATQKPDTKAGSEAARKLKTIEGWISTLQSTATAGLVGSSIGNTLPVGKQAVPSMERARVLSRPTASAQPPQPVYPPVPPPSIPAGIPPAAAGPKAWMARQLTQ